MYNLTMNHINLDLLLGIRSGTEPINEKNNKKGLKLEEETANVVKKHAQTSDVRYLFTQKRLKYNNLLSAKAEAQMAKMKYQYFENGEQTGKC